MLVIRDPQYRLEAEGVRMRDWSVGNHRTVCPACSTGRKKKRDPCLSVSINRDGSIVFFCHHCEWSGWMGRGAERLKGKERQTFRQPRPDPPKPPRRPPRLKFEPPCDAARRFFTDRRISFDTVNAFRIGQTTRSWMPGFDGPVRVLVFPYFVNGRVVNHKYRALERKAFIQDPGTRRTLFNIDRAAGATEVAIVEGEMDVLAMHEAGFPATVSLPDGASKKNNDRRIAALADSGLTDRDVRFVIAGDTDEPGRAMRAHLLEALGADRCRSVEWPVDPHGDGGPFKDAGDCLKTLGAEAVRASVEGELSGQKN